MAFSSAVSAVCLNGATLPLGVGDLDEPPQQLYLTGVIPPGPRVAIVGTRRPTAEAYRFARELALELAQSGVVVVSGGARGIDTAAHEGALLAGAGTLVVAPASYCCPYPHENGPLFERIVASGGGYLSAFETPTVARRHAFFARNGLLVSLCVTVILVQAPFRSGARNALLWARNLQRPYWVVPHAPWCSQGACSAAELRLGGKPLTCARDVQTWLAQRGHVAVPLAAAGRSGGCTSRDASFEEGAAGEGAGGKVPMGHQEAASHSRASPRDRRPEEVTERQRRSGLPQDVRRLVGVLRAGAYHPDQLCAELRWDAAHLQATLLHATLLGEVVRSSTGQFVASGDSAARKR